MSLSKSEAKHLLERIIFEESNSQEWVQDVWGLSSFLGESAAKLVDVIDALIEACPEDSLNDVVGKLCQDVLE